MAFMLNNLRDPDCVAYYKDLGSLIFMALAGIWIIHALANGNGNELKRAVSAG